MVKMGVPEEIRFTNVGIHFPTEFANLQKMRIFVLYKDTRKAHQSSMPNLPNSAIVCNTVLYNISQEMKRMYNNFNKVNKQTNSSYLFSISSSFSLCQFTNDFLIRWWKDISQNILGRGKLFTILKNKNGSTYKKK